MTFLSGEIPFSNREDYEWRNRYIKISNIIRSLDNETIELIDICITALVDQYFGDFPAVQLLFDEGVTTQEAYPIIIPVTEDVLREFGVFDED